MASSVKISICFYRLNHFSYSLYEPNDCVLMEYMGGLEKAVLSNRTLLDELNDAFCQTHPWLAQKVTTRSAHAAVSKVSADALLAKALNIRRTKAGGLLKDVRAISAIKLTENDILAGVRHHSAASEPYFYDTSYNHTKQHAPIPVDLNGRCVVAEEIENRGGHDSMRPLKWKCTSECRMLTSGEIEVVLKTKLLFQKCIDDVRAGLDGRDSGCSCVCHDSTLQSDLHYNEWRGHPICCEFPACSSPLRVIRATAPHYPVLRGLIWPLYSAHKNHMAVKAIDAALCSGSVEELLDLLGLADNLSHLFSDEGVQHAVVSDDHSSPGLGCIERHLLVTHADLIAELRSKFCDDPEFACCSCEQLCQRKQVSCVDFSNLGKYNTSIWLALKAHILQSGLSEKLYICKHCRPFLNKNTMPARCVLNGLVTEPVPYELSKLDALSKQLIQRAKAFQTIVRLGTYSRKVPAYNPLQACKGCMFFLPLPLNKTWQTLSEVSFGETDLVALPDPQLFIILNGVPTKSKVVWLIFPFLDGYKVLVRS